MGNPHLSSPLVTVVRDGHDVLTVQTDNRDLLLWDTTRLKHKWPRFDEVPNLWLTFISWAAARRTGAIPADLRYEAWAETVLDINVNTEDENAELGAPFSEEPAPGSS